MQPRISNISLEAHKLKNRAGDMNVKTITVCFLLSSFAITSCAQNAESLVPLTTYVNKNDLSDPTNVVYLYDRCQAIFMMLAVQSKGTVGDEYEKFTALSRRAYIDINIATSTVILKTQKDPDSAAKQHLDIVKKLLKIYSSHYDELFLQGKIDDFNSDPLIGGDLQVCGEVLKMIREKK